jgi:hypothetical protein
MAAIDPTRPVEASGDGPTTVDLVRELAGVLADLPRFATGPLTRHWHRSWGASEAEAGAPFLGDELLSDCQFECTRAIDIDASPEGVWPWLAQVGYGRAGFYSHDLLDNLGHPSADRIVPELQDVRVGDWIPMWRTINDRTAFRIAVLEPPRRLLWTKADSTWAWELRDAGLGCTRLITRLRMHYRWDRPAEAGLSVILNEFGDFPMMRKMLREIKRRAESHSL